MTPVAKGALFVFTSGCLSYIFLKVPAAQGFANPDLARLVTMHLPCAYVALVAAVIAAWHGIAYLRKRDLSSDIKSYVGAKIAFLYCFLTTITTQINGILFYTFRMHKTYSMKEVVSEIGKSTKNYLFLRNMVVEI